MNIPINNPTDLSPWKSDKTNPTEVSVFPCSACKGANTLSSFLYPNFFFGGRVSPNVMKPFQEAESRAILSSEILRSCISPRTSCVSVHLDFRFFLATVFPTPLKSIFPAEFQFPCMQRALQTVFGTRASLHLSP